MASRYTRHVCFSLCEMVFSSFKGQLTWQHGLYLIDQYRRLRYAEVDLQIDSNAVEQMEKNNIGANEDFTKLYIANPNKNAFERLEASATFVLAFNDLISRFSSDAAQNLFSDGLTCVKRYKEIHYKWRDCIVQQVAALEDGLERNKYEEFPLKQSPQLFYPYQEQIKRLNALESFSLQDWGSGTFSFKVDFPVSQMLYAACVLYTVNSYHEWGIDSR